MTTTSVVTNNGFAYTTSNSSNGLQVNIVGAVFSSQIISSDQTVLRNLVTLPNVVFTSTNSIITYSRIDDNNVLFRVRLGTDVGDFNIGSFGLLLPNNTLFTASSLGAIESKSKADTTGAGGDVRYYETIVNLSNIANIANLTILVNGDSSLPEVDTENQLPSPNSSSFPVYFVHRWLAYHGLNALASRYNGAWYYYPSFESYKGAFAADVVVGDAVYFEKATGLFTKAVANVMEKAPVAMCGENFGLVRIGGIYRTQTDTFVAGADYYVSNTTPGQLVANVFNNAHVGFASNARTLILNSFAEYRKVLNGTTTIYSSNNNDLATLNFNQNNNGPDYKVWRINVNGVRLDHSIVNDAQTQYTTYLSVFRNATNVTNITTTVGTATLVMSPGVVDIEVPNASIVASAYNVKMSTTNAGIGFNNGNGYFYAPNTSVTVATSRFNVTITNAGIASTGIDLYGGNVALVGQNSNISLTNGQIGMSAGPYSLSVNAASGFSVFQNNGGGAHLDFKYDRVVTNVSVTTQNNFFAGTQSDGNLVTFGQNTGNGFLVSPTVLLSEFITYKNSSGYQKLPSGLIIQWGRGNTVSGYQDFIIFPVAFPNVCQSVVINEGAVSGWRYNNGQGYPTIFGSQNYDRTAFLLSVIRIDTSNGYVTSNYEGGITYNYIAIGY